MSHPALSPLSACATIAFSSCGFAFDIAWTLTRAPPPTATEPTITLLVSRRRVT
jgi:hypothetical protein